MTGLLIKEMQVCDKKTWEQSLHSISESPGVRCEFLKVHIPEKSLWKMLGPKHQLLCISCLSVAVLCLASSVWVHTFHEDLLHPPPPRWGWSVLDATGPGPGGRWPSSRPSPDRTRVQEENSLCWYIGLTPQWKTVKKDLMENRRKREKTRFRPIHAAQVRVNPLVYKPE